MRQHQELATLLQSLEAYTGGNHMKREGWKK